MYLKKFLKNAATAESHKSLRTKEKQETNVVAKKSQRRNFSWDKNCLQNVRDYRRKVCYDVSVKVFQRYSFCVNVCLEGLFYVKGGEKMFYAERFDWCWFLIQRVSIDNINDTIILDVMLGGCEGSVTMCLQSEILKDSTVHWQLEKIANIVSGLETSDVQALEGYSGYISLLYEDGNPELDWQGLLNTLEEECGASFERFADALYIN